MRKPGSEMRGARGSKTTLRTYRRVLWILLLLHPASRITQAGAVQNPPVDWFSIDRTVVERLFTEDLGAAARSLVEAPADAGAPVWMRRLNLLVRAGHRGRAAEAVDRLAGAAGLPDGSELSHIADFLIERREWDLTRRFLERLPQAEPGWGYIFIKEWAEKGEHGEIDRWLAARAEANPAYWLKERLRLRAALGTEAELLNELAGEVRAHPSDPERSGRYLEAVAAAGTKTDVDWMGEVCKPRLAYRSYTLGRAVESRSPRAAVALFERSLALPFTEEDQQLLGEEIRKRMSAVAFLEIGERDFRLWTKDALARRYKANGRADKAQPLIEELAAANQDGLPHVSWSQFAGEVQAATGARVVEEKIVAAEAENDSSSDYWLARAKYYAGRREDARAVEAFEKALGLAPYDAPDDSKAAVRHRILREYAHYRFRTSGNDAALRVLHRELAAVPLDTRYASWLIQGVLEYERNDGRSPDTAGDRLWEYLAARGRWTTVEERLLRRLTANAPPGEREGRWVRAEKLAAVADPSRALKLGWIMTRANESARAIPLLESAVERLPEGHDPDGNDRGAAAFTLFEAYLNTGNWRGAEQIWPAARERLAPREVAEWLGRIAVAAAGAGSGDAALRLWSAKANLDRTDYRSLDELVRLGLGKSLRDFYRRLGEADPSSRVPEEASQLLRTLP